MTTTIFVKVQVAGFHEWPNALPDVGFLQHRHRHLFGISAGWCVQHSDRQMEFFMMQREVRAALAKLYPQGADGFEFGARSCETIAQELQRALQCSYVQVDEDGENGAIVE
jgi:hypothetical protein